MRPRRHDIQLRSTAFPVERSYSAIETAKRLGLDCDRMRVTDLACETGLWKPPTQARLQRLDRAGVIRNTRAFHGPIWLGHDPVSLVELRLHNTRELGLAGFNAAVVETFDYLLKLRTQYMAAFRRVLAEGISTLPHVASTATYVAMLAIKESMLGDLI